MLHVPQDAVSVASRRAATAAAGVRRLGAAAAVQEDPAPLYPDAVLTAPETQQAKVYYISVGVRMVARWLDSSSAVGFWVGSSRDQDQDADREVLPLVVVGALRREAVCRKLNC